MSPAPVSMARRGQGPTPPNPNSLSGLVARYRASDHASLADGTALTTWPDLSGQGNTLSVLANAPTKQTSGGLTSVRFASGSSQSMSKNSPTGIPAAGPVTVLAVVNWTGTTGYQVLIEYAGASNAGYAVAQHVGGLTISNYSNDTSAGGGGVTTGAVRLYAWSLASDGVTVNARASNRKYGAAGNTGGLFAGSRTRLTVGRADFFPTWALNADVMEICVFDHVLTDAEYDSLRPYFDATYGLTITGTTYSTPTSQTTSPTADGSGSCAEESILYFPSLFGGHKYWMGMVPLGSGSATNENPHIFYSDDAATWSSTGITNPVVPARASGFNADPHLFDNTARDGKIYLYNTVFSDATTANNGVWAKSSTDGVTWSAAVQVDANTDGKANQEAVVRWDGTQYVLYTQNATTFAVTRKVSSTSPVSGFGTGTAVNVTIPGGRGVWHHDLTFYNGLWYWAFSDTDTNRNLWLAVSPDGINFVCAKRPLLILSSAAWEAQGSNSAVYRPALLPPDDTTTNWRLWYSAGDVGSGAIHMGLTQFPPREWPQIPAT